MIRLKQGFRLSKLGLHASNLRLAIGHATLKLSAQRGKLSVARRRHRRKLGSKRVALRLKLRLRLSKLRLHASDLGIPIRKLRRELRSQLLILSRRQLNQTSLERVALGLERQLRLSELGLHASNLRLAIRHATLKLSAQRGKLSVARRRHRRKLGSKRVALRLKLRLRLSKLRLHASDLGIPIRKLRRELRSQLLILSKR